MKIFEIYRKQYDRLMTEKARAQINPKIPAGSYEYVHIAWKYIFGNMAVDDLKKEWLTNEEIREAEKEKFIIDTSSNKWIDRGTKRAYMRGLTIKGLKKLYTLYPTW